MSAPQKSSDLHAVSEQADPKPASAAVGAPRPQAAPASLPAKPAPVAKRGGVPIWLLGLVALIGVVAWVSQYQVSQQLEREVTALAAELESTSHQLGAYKLHLDTVRASVGDLHARVGSLKALVGIDPLAISDIAPGGVDALLTPPGSEPAPALTVPGAPLVADPAGDALYEPGYQ